MGMYENDSNRAFFIGLKSFYVELSIAKREDALRHAEQQSVNVPRLCICAA